MCTCDEQKNSHHSVVANCPDELDEVCIYIYNFQKSLIIIQWFDKNLQIYIIVNQRMSISGSKRNVKANAAAKPTPIHSMLKRWHVLKAPLE